MQAFYGNMWSTVHKYSRKIKYDKIKYDNTTNVFSSNCQLPSSVVNRLILIVIRDASSGYTVWCDISGYWILFYLMLWKTTYIILKLHLLFASEWRRNTKYYFFHGTTELKIHRNTRHAYNYFLLFCSFWS